MSKVTVYIASSLDGYIAREDGGLDWLPKPECEDYGFAAFYETVDALVLGRTTYEQVVGWGEWPHSEKPTYVLSRTRAGQSDERIRFVDTLPHPPGHVWVVGGAQVIRAYAEAGRIHEWIISVVPVLLGRGIPLFLPTSAQAALTLQGGRTFPDGLVQVHYRNGG